MGGMAELFLASDTRTQKMVVLKRILPAFAEDAEFVRMFLDEARIAASLRHPNVAEVFELGHLQDSTFIALEWIDGIDLRRVLSKERDQSRVVPQGIAAWLVARLCEGLQHAHEAKDVSGMPLGIIHRDVSPQNVMVSFRGEVKLVDFGIAKATAWVGRSKPGVVRGKLLYLAPEQLGSRAVDHRVDLFALGTLLYELTTGVNPFSRPSTEAVISALRADVTQSPTVMRSEFSPRLADIVMKCLEKDPAVRFQSAEEILRELEGFMADEAPTQRSDIVRYISRLFGDAHERTSIYIPDNVRREAPPDDEPTIPEAKAATSARFPEGRRPILPSTELKAKRSSPDITTIGLVTKSVLSERPRLRKAIKRDPSPPVGTAPPVVVAPLVETSASSVSTTGSRERKKLTVILVALIALAVGALSLLLVLQ